MYQLQLLGERLMNISQLYKIKILGVVAFICYSLALLFLVIFIFGGTKMRVKDSSRVVVFMESSPAGLMALRYLAKRLDVSIAMIVLASNAWGFNINAAYDNTVAFISTLRTAKELRYNIPVYYGSSVAQVNANFDVGASLAAGGDGGEMNVVTSCTYRRVIQPELILEAERLFGASDLLDTVQLFPFLNNNNRDSTNDDGDANNVADVNGGQYTFFEEPLADFLSHHTASFLLLGPSTDAALFLQQHADLSARVNSIVLAGGVVTPIGDTRLVYPPNVHSDQHLFFDPHAANYILSGAHGRSVVLLPLDAAPRWPPVLYESVVLSRATRQAPPPIDFPARLVALGVAGFNQRFGTGERLPYEVLAASYFADVMTRNDAAVAEMSLLVANGVALAEDGMLGTPGGGEKTEETEAGNKRGMQMEGEVEDKKGGKKDDFMVQVVMRISEDKFWERFENLDRLVF